MTSTLLRVMRGNPNVATTTVAAIGHVKQHFMVCCHLLAVDDVMGDGQRSLCGTEVSELRQSACSILMQCNPLITALRQVSAVIIAL